VLKNVFTLPRPKADDQPGSGPIPEEASHKRTRSANRSQSLVSGKLWTIQASGNGLTQVFPRGTIDLGVVLGLVRYRRAAVFCWGVRL
jgi:hypothetical protein